MSCCTYIWDAVAVYDERGNMPCHNKYRHCTAQQEHADKIHFPEVFRSQEKGGSPERYEQDKKTEAARLRVWKEKQVAAGDTNPPLIVIAVSGGGSRAAYWTFRTLQYMDSVTNGMIARNTVLVTGASGGMIGASYWRALHKACDEKKIPTVSDPKYLDYIGKDLLNAIMFSFASVDLISPVNKISIAGYSYKKDRGYAMEQEMIRNTEGLLDNKIGDYKTAEKNAVVPLMVINGTIINDGRRLLIAAQPVSYLTQPEYSVYSVYPTIDAVDCSEYFANQKGSNMRLTTALRMNATFPFVLPVVKLPSKPEINIMDAGLRDNFGTEVAGRYLYVFRDWLVKNTRNVIFIQIRDTKEYEVSKPIQMNSLSSMIADPVFSIQNKWESFQSYYSTQFKDYAPYFLNNKLEFVTFQYIPNEKNKAAALNFHLTKKEKEDIYRSIDQPVNIESIKKLTDLLQKK